MTATSSSDAPDGLSIRSYVPDDWEAIARAHDAARMQELAASVGPEAFLDLAATAEGEGLSDGEVWLAVTDDGVVGFVAYDHAEGFTLTETRTGPLVGNEAFTATGHILHRTGQQQAAT